jgi:ferritin-like metal-binding protein YciE
LYEGDLKDLYLAENHIIKALPKMANAAASEELGTAFTKHLAQAHTHVSRLKKVFAASGLAETIKQEAFTEAVKEKN